jgi:hypothetical protein
MLGPTVAATHGRFVWLIGTLVAGTVALVALRPCPPASTSARRFEQFERYRPVKKCVDGRWVIAQQPR